MKPLKERLPLIDAAIDETDGEFPKLRDGEKNNGEPFLLVREIAEFPSEKIGDYVNGSRGYSNLHFSFICTRDEFNQRAKELGYINGYKYGVEYETNGEKPDLPDDVLVQVYTLDPPCGWGQCANVEHWNWRSGVISKFRIVDKRYKPKEQDMNNDWYKKDENPPIGEVVEFNKAPDGSKKEEWVEASILAVSGEWVVFTHSGFKRPFMNNDRDKFRPLRTEKDKLIEQMYDEAGGEYDFDTATKLTNKKLLSACRLLHEQGYRKIKPMSEDEFSNISWIKCGLGPDTAKKLWVAGCRFLDREQKQ